MLFTDFSIETLAVIIIGFTWVELLIISLSYVVALMVKKTFGIAALLSYFAVSTIIYFLLFSRLVYNLIEHQLFFENCEGFFIFLGIIRIISGFVLLLSIWKQNKE